MVEETISMWITPQTSSCSLVLKARCRVVSLSRLGQARCRRHDVPQLIQSVSRRSCGVRTVRSTSIERHGTSFVMTQWSVCAVAMKVTDRAYDGIAALLFTHAKTDSIEQQRAPTQEPSKQQRVSQIGETWRGTASEKLVLTKMYVAPDSRSLCREELRRFHGRQDRSCETQLLDFVS